MFTFLAVHDTLTNENYCQTFALILNLNIIQTPNQVSQIKWKVETLTSNRVFHFSFLTTIDRVIVIHPGNVQGLIEIYRLYLQQFPQNLVNRQKSVNEGESF